MTDAPASAARPTSTAASLWRWTGGCLGLLGRGLSRWLVASILCLSWVGAVLVQGWTLRLMRDLCHSYWRRHGREALPGEGPGPMLPLLMHPTPWQRFARQTGEPGGRPRALLSALFGSVGENLRQGLLALFNLWLVTLPGGLLILAGWYIGWEVSFYKVYEQRELGPLCSLAGIVWWAMGAAYLPLAQARQAATGQWRRFHDFNLILTLIWRRAPACLLLTLGYWAVSLLALVILVLPVFLGNLEAHLLTPIWLLVSIMAVLIGLPLWLALRMWAAWIYAGGLLAWVREEPEMVHRLADSERDFLRRHDLLPIPGRPPVELGEGTSVLLSGLRLLACGALLLAWLALPFFTIHVRQFFSYNGRAGWLNQPVVQLPWLPLRLPRPLSQADPVPSPANEGDGQ